MEPAGPFPVVHGREDEPDGDGAGKLFFVGGGFTGLLFGPAAEGAGFAWCAVPDFVLPLYLCLGCFEGDVEGVLVDFVDGFHWRCCFAGDIAQI